MMTPYEKFKSLPEAFKYLKPRLSFEQLDTIAMSITDDKAAKLLQENRDNIFEKITKQQENY